MTAPVTVVTGFLGAGKTTLLNRWLAERGTECAVIVNEIGAIGIDGELLEGRARTIREITGGCICCTTHAELVRALETLSGSARIFVETSGAASPAGVVRAIGVTGLALDGVVTVVDPTRMAALADIDLAIEQQAYADVIVISRTDLVSPAELEAAHVALQSLNPTAVVTAAVGRGLDALLAARSLDFSSRPISSAHPSGIESIALTFDGEVDEERFGDWIETDLARFSGRLLRTKGIVAIGGLAQRMILQGVAERLEVSFGAPWNGRPSTRLVIVGFGLDRDALERGFEATKRR